MKSLPSPIRIHYETYDVIELDPVESAQIQRSGEYIGTHKLLRVCMNDSDLAVLNTLIHEINHAIHWHYRLESASEEEDMVCRQSSAWTQVYKDNPHLVKWILSIVK
jgi:hypothetical protein